MSTRTFLAAAALAACVWAGGGTAQAAPGAAHGAESPGPADTGGATQLPGDTGSISSAAKLRERAMEAMEALREEIATLAALRDAQAALLAWNLTGTKSGAPLQALPAALCEDPAIGAWCPLLPATFGAASTEDGHD